MTADQYTPNDFGIWHDCSNEFNKRTGLARIISDPLQTGTDTQPEEEATNEATAREVTAAVRFEEAELSLTTAWDSNTVFQRRVITNGLPVCSTQMQQYHNTPPGTAEHRGTGNGAQATVLDDGGYGTTRTGGAGASDRDMGSSPACPFAVFFGCLCLFVLCRAFWSPVSESFFFHFEWSPWSLLN